MKWEDKAVVQGLQLARFHNDNFLFLFNRFKNSRGKICAWLKHSMSDDGRTDGTEQRLEQLLLKAK